MRGKGSTAMCMIRVYSNVHDKGLQQGICIVNNEQS